MASIKADEAVARLLDGGSIPSGGRQIHGGAVHELGPAVFSFGSHFPLVIKVHDGVWLNVNKASNNTTAHQNGAKRVLTARGYHPTGYTRKLFTSRHARGVDANGEVTLELWRTAKQEQDPGSSPINRYDQANELARLLSEVGEYERANGRCEGSYLAAHIPYQEEHLQEIWGKIFTLVELPRIDYQGNPAYTPPTNLLRCPNCGQMIANVHTTCPKCVKPTGFPQK